MLKLYLLTLAFGAFALRAILSLQSYSGYATPPLYGDFEAQRHWQEITINLPISDWYTNTTDNDLMYWGLDYPPLTAYHSWAMGWTAKLVNSSFVELHKSRGITTYEHKWFMRLTVLAADVLLYIPAITFAIKTISSHAKTSSKALFYALALLYPGQMIIDNGHFQYNNISLGLACLAITAILRDSIHLSAVLFVLALNYKQMELYHALPFFFYLLSLCFSHESNTIGHRFIAGVKQVSILGIIVIATFAILWAPWLHSIESTKQLLHRIFPVARGVFEDKVSTVWCVLNVFYKLK